VRRLRPRQPEPVDCANCDGTTVCPECDGWGGYSNEEDCMECDGDGRCVDCARHEVLSG
jgi:RecJ-like exonuclease